LLSGDYAGALACAREGIETGIERQYPLGEAGARLQFARALLANDGVTSEADVRAELGRTLELLKECCGGLPFEPRVHEAHAELADAIGDTEAAQRERAEAGRLRAEMGALEPVPPAP
jgi:hypothetical protein